jgi:hypothetical protein
VGIVNSNCPKLRSLNFYEGGTFNLEFNKMFKWFGNESAPSSLKFELDLYKKLWNFFWSVIHYFIINHHNLTFDFVSREVEDVMAIFHPSLIFFYERKIHPDDRSWFLAFGNSMVDFLHDCRR